MPRPKSELTKRHDKAATDLCSRLDAALATAAATHNNTQTTVGQTQSAKRSNHHNSNQTAHNITSGADTKTRERVRNVDPRVRIARTARPGIDERLADTIEDAKLAGVMRRMLLAMLDPETATLNNRALARHLKVSETFVGRIRRSPEWAAAIKEIAQQALAQHVPSLLAAALASAQIPGKDGYWDRQMLLNAAGIVEGRGGAKTVNHTGTVDHQHHAVPGRLTKALTNRERLAQQTAEVEDGDVIEGDFRHTSGTPADGDGEGRQAA